MIVNEMDRYFQAEIRYMENDKEEKVKKMVEEMENRGMAIMKFNEKYPVESKQ